MISARRLLPLFGLLIFSVSVMAEPLGLVLPTRNQAIFGSDLSQFYMYTDRSFEGVKSRPWTGGKYGYVRNQKRTSIGVVMTRFHEGIDIKPVARDSSGNPTDTVHSMMKGTVVHASVDSSKSSYGRYVVVRHDTQDGPFFSLYAHLATITVKAGTRVGAGTPLGKMGYTGVGLDRRRAHVHVELNLMISDQFRKWHDRNFNDANHHGIYNGLNLCGIDIASLYQRHRENPSITLREFIGRMSPYYTVVTPNRGGLQLLERYPWLGHGVNGRSNPPAWKMVLSRSGVPLQVSAHGSKVSSASVVEVTPTRVAHSYNTRSRLSGTGSSASLTSSGRRYIELLGTP